jgi:hypothetical protein
MTGKLIQKKYTGIPHAYDNLAHKFFLSNKNFINIYKIILLLLNFFFYFKL